MGLGINRVVQNTAGKGFQKGVQKGFQKVGGLLGGLKNPALESMAKLKLQTQGFPSDQAGKLLNGDKLSGVGKTLSSNIPDQIKNQQQMNQMSQQVQMLTNIQQMRHDMSRSIISNIRG